MRHQRRPQRRDTRTRYTFGKYIRDQRVVVVDHNNDNLGEIDTRDALKMASDAGLDLVVVSHGNKDKPSTCKIVDLGKYKYDQERREKAAKKKQRENAVKIKEIKIRPSTSDNDLQTKAKQLQEFLDEGNRIKVTVMFRGREMAHRDIGKETMMKLAVIMMAKYEADPSMTGRNMTAIMVKGQKAQAV